MNDALKNTPVAFSIQFQLSNANILGDKANKIRKKKCHNNLI